MHPSFRDLWNLLLPGPGEEAGVLWAQLFSPGTPTPPAPKPARSLSPVQIYRGGARGRAPVGELGLARSHTPG